MLSPPLSANLWVSNACYPSCSHTFHYLARKIRCVYTYGNVFCIYKVLFSLCTRLHENIIFISRAPLTYVHAYTYMCVSPRVYPTHQFMPGVCCHCFHVFLVYSCLCACISDPHESCSRFLHQFRILSVLADTLEKVSIILSQNLLRIGDLAFWTPNHMSVYLSMPTREHWNCEQMLIFIERDL